MSMIDPKLADKVVVVTGANNPYGIGAAVAKAFAKLGSKVLVHFFRPLAEAAPTPAQMGEAFYNAMQTRSADWLVDEIRALGGQAVAWEAELSNAAIIPQLFDQAETMLGPVDVVINNAAFCLQDTFLPPSAMGPDSRAVDGFRLNPITPEIHDQHFSVNSRAVALIMAEYARRHVARRARWGCIINVSTDGADAFASEVSYGASKHALESFSRAAAIELGPYGITVNVVSPGPIQTGWISPEMERDIAKYTPLRRVGRPEDVADVITLLASEQARWLTGQLLYVGGGHKMPS